MVIRRGCEGARLLVLTTDAGRVRRVGDSDGLGVLVLCVVLLGVDLLVFLEVLRTLEWLLANFAYMRLQRGVHCSGSV